MREWIVAVTELTITIIDGLALAVVIFGTLEVCLGMLKMAFAPASEREKRDIWLRYGRWLVAALTFQLGADIIETSITTDWATVGRIGAVAVIRTFLNYFLERDLSDIRDRDRAQKAE